MSTKKQKLRDTTNLTPEDARTMKAVVAAESIVNDGSVSSSVILDDPRHNGSHASARSLEQHYVATVHAVLQSLRQSCSQSVPWSAVAVSVA
jgi:hypothetical protein